ncbi:MAG: hypothetical protein K2P93_09720 [Alphaproteobacteria bacterium]|nr:hypothetical protein [Alphaproteobacteria bacterium]
MQRIFRNQVAPGIAVTIQFTKGLYIIANVSAQLGSGQNLGDVLLRVGYGFQKCGWSLSQ